MGKWNNRRWVPRKNYRDPPLSPSRNYHNDYNFRGVNENCMLPWEKKFCISAGIPWQKVVVVKKYMNSHNTIVKWNDSEGEESFHAAKKRFWSDINGLPCDDSPPDPYMYSGEIDWDAEVDPELISDLDRAYFNPDEPEKVKKVESTNQDVSINPWEDSNAHRTENLKERLEGWNTWDKPTISENGGNPWEKSGTQGDGATSGSKSWGQKDNSWGHSGQNVGNSSCDRTNWEKWRNVDNKGESNWGTQPNRASEDRHWGDSGSKSWGQNNNMDKSWGHNGQNVGNSSNDRTHWGNLPSGNDSWGRKRWENQNNDSNYIGRGRGRGAFNGGWRKREGPEQHTSRFKSARLENDNNQWGHQRN